MPEATLYSKNSKNMVEIGTIAILPWERHDFTYSDEPCVCLIVPLEQNCIAILISHVFDRFSYDPGRIIGACLSVGL